MRFITAILMVATLFLGGCTDPATLYVKDGATADDIRRDNALCKEEALARYGPAIAANPLMAVWWERCLEQRGYRRIAR